jgi:catechol 2,3-dioxygenase-like lactoylglutathione lyase family enzyme
MELAIPILPADDLRAARAFYVDGLGFAIRFEASEDGRTGLLGLARGSMWLTIDAPMSGHGRAACVSLQVEDADRYYAEWRGRVEVGGAPQDQPWGARTFSVHDPAGNTIFVMGAIAGATRQPPAV